MANNIELLKVVASLNLNKELKNILYKHLLIADGKTIQESLESYSPTDTAIINALGYTPATNLQVEAATSIASTARTTSITALNNYTSTLTQVEIAKAFAQQAGLDAEEAKEAELRIEAAIALLSQDQQDALALALEVVALRADLTALQDSKVYLTEEEYEALEEAGELEEDVEYNTY